MRVSNKTNFHWKIYIFGLSFLFKIYHVMPL